MDMEDYVSIVLICMGFVLITSTIVYFIEGLFFMGFVTIILSILCFLSVSIVNYKTKVK